MTTYGVSDEEKFPFCTLYQNEHVGRGPVIDLTDAELADYERVTGEFSRWQERMESAHGAYLASRKHAARRARDGET